jgi:hypothetical protein
MRLRKIYVIIFVLQHHFYTTVGKTSLYNFFRRCTRPVLLQQDCGSCETIFYSAFCHQMKAADSWRVYNLQYKIQHRIQVYSIHVYINTYTVYRLQVYVIRNTYTVYAFRRYGRIVRTHRHIRYFYVRVYVGTSLSLSLRLLGTVRLRLVMSPEPVAIPTLHTSPPALSARTQCALCSPNTQYTLSRLHALRVAVATMTFFPFSVVYLYPQVAIL